MDLRELTTQVERVSRQYAATFGLADVVCQALLIGSHHWMDVQASIDQKWLSRLP